MKHALCLAVLLSLAAGVQDAKFEDPVRLRVGDQAINETEGILYPTPVLLDIDQDGRQELVIGDLRGNLRVHENEAKEGEPVWGKAVLLQADGKDLKVPNW